MTRTNKVRAGGLFSLQDMGSSWLSRTRPAEDLSVEEDFEEIAEEIEEDIDEVQDYAQEPEVSIMEEVQEQPSVSNSRENYSYTSISELAESNLQLRHISDAELRLNQQRNALDESTKALHHLQREYTDLGRRHRDIHSDHRELLKTHSALQMKYERLCYAQGKPRPHFSPPQFTTEL